jgi:SAM-dependent methyltransferase
VDDDRRFGLPGFGPSTYGDSFADVYDDWYADLGDGDVIRALADLLPARPARVLELGVGTGRMLEALADLRRDTADDLVGIDSSPAMLDRARARLGDRATLLEGDFSRFLPAGRFDLVFAGWNTFFNLPDDDALASCLGLVSGALDDDSVFLFDAVVPRGGSADHVGVRSMTADGVVLSVSRLDTASRRITGQFVELADGAPPRLRPWSVRWWTPDEIAAAASSAGLTVAALWSDGTGAPFDESSERMVVQLRRTAPHEEASRVVS